MTKHEILCLKQALLTLEDCEVNAFERLDDPIPPYSEQFERNMQQLIYSNHQIRSSFKTRGSRIWGVLCALIIILALSLSISAIREPLFKFITTIYQNAIGFYVQEADSPSSILEHYTIEHVPEEYVLQNDIRYEGLHITEWWNEDQYISLTQTLLQSTNLSSSTKDNDGEMLLLRETEVFHITSKGVHTFIWSENGYAFVVLCPETVPWNTIKQMLESIHPTTP